MARDVLNRRDDVAAAALAEFSEQGFQRASLRQIADRAGMTQAAIYYHYKNKEDLLMDISAGFADRIIELLMKCRSGPGPAANRLARLVTSQIALARDYRREVKVLIEDKYHLTGSNLEVIRQKEKAIFDVYRKCLEEMREEGDLTDVDPTAAAFSILGAINWTYHWYRDNGPVSFEALRHTILVFTLGGCCSNEQLKAELSRAAESGDEQAEQAL